MKHNAIHNADSSEIDTIGSNYYPFDEGKAIEDSTSLFDENRTARFVIMGALAIAALLSFFLLAAHFSSPETYAGTIESLDAKKTTVMELIAASTAASGAITLLPGDAGTPIAEKLVDLSSDFLIVLAAIYLEKYLLTVLGFAAFKILIPLACALGIAALVFPAMQWRKALAQLAAKLALFGIAMCLLVPASVLVSNMIESTYQDSIDATLAASKQSTEELEAAAQENGDSDESLNSTTEENTGPLAAIVNTATNVVTDLSSNAQEALDRLQETLNHYIEALALMIVTSCIIPILVLLFFLWMVKTMLGVDIQVPTSALRPRSIGRR